MNNKGYMSTTTNTFMIGILGKGTWIADDIALNRDDTSTFNYSVVSQTQVKVLEISKQDMINKMPRDFILDIENTYQDRKNWKTVRMQDIKKTNKDIYKKDENCDAYREAIDNISKLHTTASTIAQNNFRNKFLSVTSPKQCQLNGNQKQTIVENYTLRKRIELRDKAAVNDKPIRSRMEVIEHHRSQQSQVKEDMPSFITEHISESPKTKRKRESMS